MNGYEKTGRVHDLRTRAEERLGKTREAVKAMPVDEAQELVYELQVHQIELELQNEELRRTELQLEASRDSYLDLYDFAPVGYVTLDPMGIIFESNLAAATLLGVERRKLIPEKLEHFLHRPNQRALHRHLEQVFSTGTRHSCEIQIRTPDDTPLHVRLESVAAEADDETRTRWRTALIDITARKRAEEALRKAHDDLEVQVRARTTELQRANAEIETLLYSTTHYLRAPLVTLQGFLDLLKGTLAQVRQYLNTTGADSPEGIAQATSILDVDAAHAMARLANAGVQLDTLVCGLLDLARIGRDPLVPARIDMNRLAANVVGDLERMIEAQGAAVTVHDLPPATGDAEEIQRVLANLLTNALQNLDPDRPGVIEIGCSGTTDDRNRYFVRDNGVGIERRARDRAFMMFIRLRRSEDSGGGVGLPIAKKIVERHGGCMDVESEVDRGSTFSFLIKDAR